MNITISKLFKGSLNWKVLSYFLEYPSGEVYVKELARLLKIGPTSANNALRLLAKAGLLARSEKARSHFYSLNNELLVARFLKEAYFMARLEEAGAVDKLLEADEGLISLCVYGSFANGAFDGKSDLDLLIISQKEKTAFNPAVSGLEDLLKLEVNIEVFTLSKWNRLKEENKEFYQEVLTSHTLLYGSHI